MSVYVCVCVCVCVYTMYMYDDGVCVYVCLSRSSHSVQPQWGSDCRDCDWYSGSGRPGNSGLHLPPREMEEKTHVRHCTSPQGIHGNTVSLRACKTIAHIPPPGYKISRPNTFVELANLMKPFFTNNLV